jgi:hypothetical protein
MKVTIGGQNAAIKGQTASSSEIQGLPIQVRNPAPSLLNYQRTSSLIPNLLLVVGLLRRKQPQV